MIERYRDHAANERTYLAWIRTGITIIALGFLVEKFDLFLAVLGPRASRGAVQALPSVPSAFANVALVLLGIIITVWATVRYFAIKRAIDKEGAAFFDGTILNLFLSLVLVSCGIYLLVHLLQVL
jgi:putative membrane protein